MATILFLRHGQSTANVAGVLAGRTPGIELTTHGIEQASKIADFLPLHVDGIYHSPLLRCAHTAKLVHIALDHRNTPTTAVPEPAAMSAFNEVDYGQWSGNALADLKKQELWDMIEHRPSRVAFPGGESLAQANARVCKGIAELLDAHPGSANIIVVTHGDVIKMALAQALGMPLDDFQRLAVLPGSISSIVYAPQPDTQTPSQFEPRTQKRTALVTGVSICQHFQPSFATDLGGGDVTEPHSAP